LRVEVVLEGAASKPPLGGTATQTRGSWRNVLSGAQRINLRKWYLMRCAPL
jgi:hypothetical protein